jgi:UDPglucose 6-dehydrogenase
LVTSVCLAELGNVVACIDSDVARIQTLLSGQVPFYEPGLIDSIRKNRLVGRLDFHVDVAAGIRSADFIFIAVGTPMLADGTCDLSAVRSAAREIARHLTHDAIVVNKSTVPVETGDLVSAIIREHARHGVRIRFVCNPEFTREGSAIADFMSPDRIVIGVSDETAVPAMRELYAQLDAPFVVTDVRTAEMIKCTANAFLAMKISFVNEIAAICERVGADVRDVVAGAGSDARIGTAFSSAGLGFGGSCFPKDVAALARVAEKLGTPSRLLSAVLAVNEAQIAGVAGKLEAILCGLDGKTVAVLGLAFKPETDDVRESPAIKLAAELVARGSSVTAHDPVAMTNARPLLGERVTLASDPYEAVRGADAVVVATEWQEYADLDLAAIAGLMCGNVVVDARNALDAGCALALGLRYIRVGRPDDAVRDSAPTSRANERA